MPARPIAVRLDEDLLELVETAAKAKNVSMSEEIRDRLLSSFEEGKGGSGNQDFDVLSAQVHATHLAVARGFEGVFRALAEPDSFDLDEALVFVKRKLREGL